MAARSTESGGHVQPVTHWLFDRLLRERRAQPPAHAPAAGRNHRTRPDGQPRRARNSARWNCSRWNWTCRWPSRSGASPTNALLLDALNGNQTLFVRDDEVEAAWRWIDSISAAWRGVDAGAAPSRGLVGPAAARAFLPDDVAGPRRGARRRMPAMEDTGRPARRHRRHQCALRPRRHRRADVAGRGQRARVRRRRLRLAARRARARSPRRHRRQGARHGRRGRRPRVDGDEARITNFPWVISIRRSCEASSAAHAPGQRLHLRNRWRVPALQPDDVPRSADAMKGQARRTRCTRAPSPSSPALAFGVGGLLIRRDCRPTARHTEGGHVDFAPARRRKRDPAATAQNTAASIERLVSGNTQNLHRALSASPASIQTDERAT